MAGTNRQKLTVKEVLELKPIEVEEEKKGEFINLRIKGIFIDGKLVKAQQGFGGNRGKSLEEIKSNETIEAAKIVADLIIADKLEAGDLRLSRALNNWLLAHLDGKEPKKEPVKEPRKTASPATTAQATECEPITAEQKKRLKELQEKLPGRMKELTTKWGWEITAVSKLTTDQAKHLIEEMEKEQPYPKAGE